MTAAPDDPQADASDEEALVDLAPGDEPAAADAVPEVVPPAGRLGALAPLRNPLDRFLAEARRYPRLSEAEERVLGIAVRERGDMNAARKLVVHNLRLVVAIA